MLLNFANELPDILAAIAILEGQRNVQVGRWLGPDDQGVWNQRRLDCTHPAVERRYHPSPPWLSIASHP